MNITSVVVAAADMGVQLMLDIDFFKETKTEHMHDNQNCWHRRN